MNGFIGEMIFGRSGLRKKLQKHFGNMSVADIAITVAQGVSPDSRYVPDGQKFLTVEFQREIPQPLVRIVENWLPNFRSRLSR